MLETATAFAFIRLSNEPLEGSALSCDPAAPHRKPQQARLIEEIAHRYGATGLDWCGGGVLVAFEIGSQAVCCAFDLLDAPANAFTPTGIRVGIDASVDPDDSDEAKATAVALSRRAKAGDILVSSTTRSTIRPDPNISFEEVGPIDAAHAPLPIEAFRAGRATTSAKFNGLRFGQFTVDSDKRELLLKGEPVPLEPLTFDLLLLLISNDHRVVSRDEIFASLWDGRIVSDTALSSQVKMLRQALGDSGLEQHTIATAHRRGFRFVRDVTRMAAAAAAPPPDVPAQTQEFGRPLIAVLPFENMSTDNSGQFFADGITEDILNALSKHRWMGVVARNPAFAFRNSGERVDVIAGQLGATHVVTGSLRRMGEQMRISAEAVEVRSMRRLWSDTFEIDSARVFDVQDEICGTIAARLATELNVAEQQRARRLPRANRGAWELYHLGMAEFYRFTRESNRRAQDFLRMAIRAEPEFADSYTRLAYAITLEMVYFEGRVSPSSLDNALDLAQRGLERDDRDPQGHFALGRVRLARQEYDLAIDALEHALELNPFLAVSHCGLGDSLAYEGRIDEAIQHFDRAIELSPHDPFRWAFYSYKSLAHLFGQDEEAAVRVACRAVQVPNAHYSAHANLLAALGYTGDEPRIERARANLMRAKPDFTLDRARSRLFYLKSRTQLDRYLQGLTLAGID